MKKLEKLLKRLDKAWCAFLDSYSGLSEAELLLPGVAGAWSLKDLIAHVSTWEEEALRHLPFVLRGENLPRYSVVYGGIDAFNARTSVAKRDLALSEVLRQSDQTHRKLVEYIESVPEEHLGGETRFRRRLRLDTYGHYAKHTAAIRKWRNSIN